MKNLIFILFFVPVTVFSQIQHIEHGTYVKTDQYQTDPESGIGIDDEGNTYDGAIIEYEDIYYIQFWSKTQPGKRGDKGQIHLISNEVIPITKMNSDSEGSLWVLGDSENVDKHKQTFMLHQLSITKWQKMKLYYRDSFYIVESTKGNFFQKHILQLDSH